MPRSALAHVQVDHCLSLYDLPELLDRLTKEELAEAGGYAVREHVPVEVKIAREEAPLD
jgi:hypothetical protein